MQNQDAKKAATHILAKCFQDFDLELQRQVLTQLRNRIPDIQVASDGNVTADVWESQVAPKVFDYYFERQGGRLKATG